LQLHRRLVGIEAVAERSIAALEYVSDAVIVVDKHGCVLHANRAAESLLRVGDGLTMQRGEVCAAAAADRSKLRALVASVSTSPGQPGTNAGGRLTLSRPSGRMPLRIVVAPIAGSPLFLAPGHATAAIFVRDPEQRPSLSEDEIRCLLGVTRAEAQLAYRLAQGHDLAHIANASGTSINTLRTRLKAILAKTGTHRQIDLVWLIRDWPGRGEQRPLTKVHE